VVSTANPILRVSLHPKPMPSSESAQFSVVYSSDSTRKSQTPPYHLEIEPPPTCTTTTRIKGSYCTEPTPTCTSTSRIRGSYCTEPTLPPISSRSSRFEPPGSSRPVSATTPDPVFSFEKTADHCLLYCAQTTQKILEICDKSISQDLDFEELSAAVKGIQIQCEKMSDKTYQKCMDMTTKEAESTVAGPDESELCDLLVKEIFDKTSQQCYIASEQIALDVLPLYEKIIGDCTKKSLECAVEILGLVEAGNNIEALTELQDRLIQSTVTSSIYTSDCILNTILSI